MEQIYKSIRRLERKGFIQPYSHFQRKAYHVTLEGGNCLRSYAKVFDEVFHGYLQEIG
jgi:DNA-binding PadR family transcriptional regulator